MNEDYTADYHKSLRNHYNTEYHKLLNTQLLDDKKLGTLIDSVNFDVWSLKNRIVRNVQMLKHGFLTQKSNVISACFKMTLNKTSCIYAFLHTKYDSRSKPNTQNIFFCASPTYRSQDGEYRGRLIPWRNFEPIFTKYADAFETAEEIIVQYMQAGELTFQVDFCYPIGCPRLSKYEESINDQRLPIKFLILCWIYDAYQIHFDIIENHTNPAYYYIMNELADIDAIEALVKKIGHDKYISMMVRISDTFGDVNASDYNIVEPRCGQKILPISSLEAVRTDDPTYNVWREVYLTNLLSDLVLNLICPSFPFINNWFYIQNAHAGIFDNSAMHEKYMASETAEVISDKLKEIDHANFIDGDVKKGPLNNKFYRLSKHIHKSIVYADSDIKLTDLAVCMTTEYVGRTIRDIPMLIVNKEFGHGLNLIFTDYDIFSKHIFEFIYAFFCMNTKLGIMHGDLHLNNATIMRLYTMEQDGNVYVKDPYIVYMVRQTPYIFKHVGLFSMIIDSSRAILGDYGRLEHEFSPRLAQAFFKEQRVRMMHIINNYFPNIMKKFHEKLETMIYENFPLMFKILTAVDAYVLLSNLGTLIDQDESFKIVKVPKNAVELLAKIVAMSETLILDNINSAIKGQIVSPDDIEWPIYTILTKCFEDRVFVLSDPPPNIVDFYNSNSDVQYDMEDYDTWGPLLALDVEFEMQKKFNIPMTDDAKIWFDYKHFDESESILDITSKYETEEHDVLQFESWMLL